MARDALLPSSGCDVALFCVSPPKGADVLDDHEGISFDGEELPSDRRALLESAHGSCVVRGSCDAGRGEEEGGAASVEASADVLADDPVAVSFEGGRSVDRMLDSGKVI